MTHLDEIAIGPLTPGDLPLVARYWQRAHPLHPINESLLRERLFGPPGADADLMLAARRPGGDLAGLATAVFPCREADAGGVRWLGVAPETAGRGLEARLLNELCARLGARGAK
ncbi:MAG: hypothetical protein M1457_09010, partial [bacterium]|nr:hypothetical protein [bacterium]